MSHVFVSHSSRDGAVEANALVAALEASGLPCWIAPRNVKPGLTYPGQIFNAIQSSVGLVLLVTPGSNDSQDVLQEVQIAHTARKPIAPVIVGQTTAAADIAYYIGVRHQIAWAGAERTCAQLSITFGHQKQPAEPPQSNSSNSYELFDLYLNAFNENRKIMTIKIVRETNNMGLKDAKDLVEGPLPALIAPALMRKRAEAAADEFKRIGAATTMRPHFA